MRLSILILIRLTAAIVCMAFLNAAQSQNLHRQIEELRRASSFEPLPLLAPLDPRSFPLPEALPAGARCFALERTVFYDFFEKTPNTFSIQLESSEIGRLQLDLIRVELEGEGFEVREAGANRNILPYTAGIHYRGALSGEDGSAAAFSVFADGTVMGLISGAEGVWVLGPIEQDPDQRLILYRSENLPRPNPFVCGADTGETSDAGHVGEPEASERNSACKTVAVYLECDYKLYQDRGGNASAAVNYVSGLFNQVAALFANDQISVSIAQIQVWTTPDPYVGMGSTAAVLNAFRTNKGVNFPGQLAHFLTTRNIGGGIAYLDVICSKQFAFGVSAITNSYQNVPTYSWSVEVLTHELGHNLGSWHTQSCNWPGGPIDNCVQPEGNCAPGPAPVNGGAIMSYCHLTPAGINFNHGFGPLPRNRIQARIEAAACISASANANAPTNLQSANLGPTSAALSWSAVPGAANYTVQFQALGSQIWLTAATISTPAYTLTNLTPLTAYNWRVKSDCSPYSVAASFTTTQQSGGGSNCASPQTLATLGVGNTSASVQWSASPGATSYTIQFKIANASAWTTAGNTFGLTFNLTGLTPNTQYHWRVKANCSDYSKIGYFTTSGNNNPVQCAVTSGLTNLRVNPTNAQIGWLATPGASQYTLQIKQGANGAYQTLGSVPVTKVSVSGLQPGTTYYWRVKANCAPSFSPALLLQTPSMLQPNAKGLPEGDEQDLCTLWPNPADEVLQWKWTSAAPEPTYLQIFDTAGRIWYEQAFDGDYHAVGISGLPPGVYAARALRGDKAAVRMWTKAR